MTQPGSYGASGGGYDSQGYSDAGNAQEGRERGSRRRAIAGYLKAANDLRKSYQNSSGWSDRSTGGGDEGVSIPGSFPDVSIVRHGDEQLVLFPSYCKRHVKERPNDRSSHHSMETGDAEYWKREWEKMEDDKAIVDVDVRGWVYSPHKGQMSRKNRILVGLARQLSGIPAPNGADSPKSRSRANSPDPLSRLRGRHEEHEAEREQERIAKEAEEILKKGKAEGDIAAKGQYSEDPTYDSEAEDSPYSARGRHGGHRSATLSRETSPAPGSLGKRASWNQPANMSQEELEMANANLMARLMPFLTNPLVSIPITIFFYDDKTSQSKTVMTNDSGHFNIRAALDFVPTHVRVLASDKLSATEEVKITEPKGVSLISDVDDTIKHSSIGSGAREIFRNAFIRDLADLTIDGVKEWYNTMYDMGVGIHYVSNSPWQLFPVLVSFFGVAGLPPGSYHLKQYSGMLQGIFEPVAERKKGTLERILRDFPERKFILVGDSGEADLEVYTDIALAHPGRVIAIFIRDVTSPTPFGYFDADIRQLPSEPRKSKKSPSRGFSADSIGDIASDHPERRPRLPQRTATETKPQTSDGPSMGNLIDFSEEPEELPVHQSHRTVLPRSMSDLTQLEPPRRKSAPEETLAPVSKKTPPIRPLKPLSLRSLTAAEPIKPSLSPHTHTPPAPLAPPAPPARRGRTQYTKDDPASQHPLAQAQSTSELSTSAPSQGQGYLASAREKVSHAYNAMPSLPHRSGGGGSAGGAGNSSTRSPTNTKAANIHATRDPATTSGSATSAETALRSITDIPAGPPLPARRGVTARAADTLSKRLSWNTGTGTATRSADTSDDESPSPNSSINLAGAAGSGGAPIPKKLELWRRRWHRARDVLEAHNVVLRSWRKGEDVCLDAVRLVEAEMRAMGVEGYGDPKGAGKAGKGGKGEGEVRPGGEVKVKDLKKEKEGGR